MKTTVVVALLLMATSLYAQDGSSGSRGTPGTSANNGAQGEITIVSGCSGRFGEIKNLSSTFDTSYWVESFEFRCSDYLPSESELEGAHLAVTNKINDLLSSGFFTGARDLNFGIDFESLKKRINTLGEMMDQVGNSKKQDLECRSGVYQNKYGEDQEVQSCFSMTAELSQNKVIFLLGYKVLDSSGKLLIFSEEFYLEQMPKICDGIPVVTKSENRTAGGGKELYTHTLKADCGMVEYLSGREQGSFQIVLQK